MTAGYLNVLGVFADARPISTPVWLSERDRDRDETVRACISKWSAEAACYTTPRILVAVFEATAVDDAIGREWRCVDGNWRATDLPTGGAR